MGDDGREEDDGGRRYGEGVSPRSSYSLVMDLTERLCDRTDGLRLCDESKEMGDSALVALGPRPLSDTLARRDWDRIRSPAIVVVVFGEEDVEGE